EKNQEQEYEVERILEEKEISRRTHYLVKWKGYNNSENTYEPIKNLRNATQVIKRYRNLKGALRVIGTGKDQSTKEDQSHSQQNPASYHHEAKVITRRPRSSQDGLIHQGSCAKGRQEWFKDAKPQKKEVLKPDDYRRLDDEQRTSALPNKSILKSQKHDRHRDSRREYTKHNEQDDDQRGL
ncbi:hypothetical protein H101_08118, partial [Trichophyton interdigitale H6]